MKGFLLTIGIKMKNKLKKISAICLIIIISIVLSSCEKSKTDMAEETKNEKVLVYGSSDYTNINPALYEHGEINSLIFSGLTTHNEKNEVVPELAQKWEFDKENNTYSFYLKEGIKFQDGEPCTAEDIKFTLETIMNPENQSEIASNYEDIKAIKVIDENRIEIQLKAPNIAMLDYLSIGILPKHLLEGKDIRTDSFNRSPIGTGPYQLTNWDFGQSITLEKSSYYYAKNSNIDKIIFKIVEDTSIRALQLKSGELDLAQVTPKDINFLKNEKDFFIEIMHTADYRGILYNFSYPLFQKNRGLVNALSYAIDRKAILDSVLLGHGTVAYSPLQMGAYSDINIEHFDYNQEKAQKELEKLGWEKNEKGFYEKEGEQLSFTIHCMEGDQVRIDMASICAQQFREIGVDVNVLVDAEIDWEGQAAFLIGWGSPFDPDDHTYKVFGTKKGSNYNSYSNKNIDVLLQKAREIDNQKERKQLYMKFQEELIKDLPYTFLVYLDAIYAGKKEIKGITPDKVLGHHGVGIFWNIADWDIQTIEE